MQHSYSGYSHLNSRLILNLLSQGIRISCSMTIAAFFCMACAMQGCAACIPSGPRFQEFTLPVALICDCHFWYNSNDHCHCHCIQPDKELRSFCFPIVFSKISWPYFAISACPRALSLLRKSGMPPYSTAEQKFRTNDSDSIHRNSWVVSSTNSRCFVPRACIPFFHQRFQLLSTILYTWPMQPWQFLKLGPEGLSWNWFFCCLFPLAFHESIFCILGIALVAPSLSIERTVVHPLQRQKPLHTVCTLQSCFLPLQVFVVVMQLPQSALHP